MKFVKNTTICFLRMVSLYSILFIKKSKFSKFIKSLTILMNKGDWEMKKKIAIAVIALIILAGAGFGIYKLFFSTEEINLSDKVLEKSSAYRTDLLDSAATLVSNDKIEEYLCNWAESKGVNYNTDVHGNVIMTADTSEIYKAASPTVLVCTYDATQFNNCVDPMAVALYVIKNNESTGTLSVIFTPSVGNDFSGIKSLNSKYFPDAANVFCLNGGQKAMFSTKTGAMSAYTLTNSIETTEPTGSKALTITISGLPGGSPDGRISSYPNPVKMLSDLLAYFKTNAYIYELSSISGGTGAGVYPQSATMTIVIGTDTMTKFTDRLDTEIEDFLDDYSEDYPDATYTYAETSLPEKVLTEDSNNSFVSLMYTLDNGVYFRDDDDNLVSITNIGSLQQDETSMTLNVTANSLSDEKLAEIDVNQSTICSLSNAAYTKTDTVASWSSDAESSFAQAVADAFNEYSGKTMEYADQVATTNANYVFTKNQKCNIMSVTLYDEKVERYAGTIVTFLLNQTHAE